MDIIQKEKNGIVCFTIKGRMEAELTLEFKEVVNQIVEGDKKWLLIYIPITESVESELNVFLAALKSAKFYRWFQA